MERRSRGDLFWAGWDRIIDGSERKKWSRVLQEEPHHRALMIRLSWSMEDNVLNHRVRNVKYSDNRMRDFWGLIYWRIPDG